MKQLMQQVLIPLVQGRFLFVNGNAADSARGVLSPLVQGRFLFGFKVKKGIGSACLNPFGSGTFFIMAIVFPPLFQ